MGNMDERYFAVGLAIIAFMPTFIGFLSGLKANKAAEQVRTYAAYENLLEQTQELVAERKLERADLVEQIRVWTERFRRAEQELRESEANLRRCRNQLPPLEGRSRRT
jgi:hypothetical protein